MKKVSIEFPRADEESDSTEAQFYSFPPDFDRTLWKDGYDNRLYKARVKDLDDRLSFQFVKEGRFNRKASELFSADREIPASVVSSFCRLFRDGLFHRSIRLQRPKKNDRRISDDDPDSDTTCYVDSDGDDQASLETSPVAELVPLLTSEASGETPFPASLIVEFEEKIASPPPPQRVPVKGPSTWPGKHYVPTGTTVAPEGREDIECVFHDRHLASLMDCRVFRKPQDPESAEEILRRSEKPWRTNVFVGESGIIENVCQG